MVNMLFISYASSTHFIPVDFIATVQSQSTLITQHHPAANCLAQAAALMQGSGNGETSLPMKHMPGNKPSNMLLLTKMTPRALGQLLACMSIKYLSGYHLAN